MRVDNINGITVLYADEGKTLQNSDTYSTEVWLGSEDNSHNWIEIDRPLEEIMKEQEQALRNI